MWTGSLATLRPRSPLVPASSRPDTHGHEGGTEADRSTVSPLTALRTVDRGLGHVCHPQYITTRIHAILLALGTRHATAPSMVRQVAGAVLLGILSPTFDRCDRP